MAGPSTREASPRWSAPAGTSGDDTLVPAITFLLLGGLALRLIIAYVLLPGSGFPNDISSFEGWSGQLVAHTPLGFYDQAGFLDYPPVYLLFLWVIGLLGAPFGGLGEGVKLIPIFTDLALAYVVFVMARELGASQRRSLIVMIVMLVNPVTWFNSAIWGQADTVGALFMLLGLRALLQDRRELASVLAVVAALTKIQLGILVFLVAFVVLRRSLRPREGKAEPARILTSLAAGIGAAALICLPFTGLEYGSLLTRLEGLVGILFLAGGLITAAGIYWVVSRSRFVVESERRAAGLAGAVVTVVVFAGMSVGSIVTHIVNTFGEYPYLTLNAYNPWALVGDKTSGTMASYLAWVHDSPYTDQGQNYPGFQIGPIAGRIEFGPIDTTWVSFIALVLVALAVVTLGAWLLARRMSEVEPVADASPADPPSGDAADGAGRSWEGPKPPLSIPGELRVVALVAGVTALGIFALLLAGLIVGGIPAAIFGDVLVVAVIAAVVIWAAWRDDRLSIVVALTILAIAFFVVPTRAHERYLFPFFAVGALLMAVSWRWTAVYVVLSVVNTANLLAVLVEYTDTSANTGIPISDGPIAQAMIDWGNFLKSAQFPAEWGGFFLTPSGVIWPIALSAVVMGLAMIWALLQMRPRAGQVLAWEAARAGEEGRLEEEELPAELPAPSYPEIARPAAPIALAAAGAEGPLDPGSGAAGHEPPEELRLSAEEGGYEGEYGESYGEEEGFSNDRPEFVPGFVMNAWRWLSRRSSMPDRTASLASEPRGRFDRLDLWVVVMLIVVASSFRIWRLDEPRQMYFDEVYHARTATEFLQDWRYGIPHDVIYEWTHPMLAKYLIAAGITIFSDDKVTSTGDLGVPIKDAVVEPRLTPNSDSGGSDPRSNPDARLGDRLFVATGTSVQAYDLQTRTLEWQFTIPGASALSIDDSTNYLYVGTSENGKGHLWRIDTNQLDLRRLGAAASPAAVDMHTQLDFGVTHLYAGSPPLILAVDGAGHIVSVDGTGKIQSSTFLAGAADFAPVGTTTGLIRKSTSSATSSDLPAEAEALASVLQTDPASIQQQLEATGSPGLAMPLNLGPVNADQLNQIQNLITNGDLPDIDASDGDPTVAVAYHDGVGLMDAKLLTLSQTITTDQPATSIAINPDTSQHSYVAAGDSVVLVNIGSSGSNFSLNGDQPLQKMPGPVTRVYFDPATKVAQALGKTPDGSGWTVYAIESNGNAVFSDARLPWQPVTMGADVTADYPSVDREALLAFSPTGAIASVDIGQFAFGWRIMGVLFGVLLAVCLYLLARLLFKRRSVGLLVAFFSLTDGMLFAQSRIAMNDTYVGGFLMLGYLIFALLWLSDGTSRRARMAFWLGMPLLGLILGLALASKWVGLYAMLSIGILILIRSALGRLITVLGLAAGTGVLGWMAIDEMRTLPNTGDVPTLLLLGGLAIFALVVGVYAAMARARTTPDRILFVVLGLVVAVPLMALAMQYYPAADQNGAPNYTFFVMMLAATAIAAAANVYHPVAWSREEFWFATIAPGVIGVVLFLVLLPFKSAGILTASWTVLGAIPVSFIAAGIGAAVIFYAVGILKPRYFGGSGFGPLAVSPPLDDPSMFAGPPSEPPKGWLRLGSGFGLPAAWMVGSLLIVPFAIYIALYIPWAMPWHSQPPDSSPGMPVIFCPHSQYDQYYNDLCPTGDGWPSGHTGQTLMGLTIGMYNYHNDLRATHAASSPWWAWPMDLKPVWFESIGYGQDTQSMIYDGGNPVLWWLAIGAMGFLCWQAFKRRSLGLTLIAVAFFWQWMSWARIDRASFQYHFYTALPFFLLGLAYLLAELWHGPSRRTWLLARVSVALAILFPALLWLAKYPLCTLARVNLTDPNIAYWTQSACGTTVGDWKVQQNQFLIGVVLILGLAWLVISLVQMERATADGEEQGSGWILQMLGPVALAGVAVLWLGSNGPQATLFEIGVHPDVVALLLIPFLGLVALAALAARDSRRLTLVILVAALIAFLTLYPNLSALPMPGNIASIYNGFLPTWLYGFQFAVNLQPSVQVGLLTPYSAAVTLATLFVATTASYLSWTYRDVTGRRRRQLVVGDDESSGPAAAGRMAGEVEG